MAVIPDLLFHVVSKRKWQSLVKNGLYRPDTFDEHQGVDCVSGSDLNHYLNERYHGRKNLLLIVIEVSRLQKKSEIKVIEKQESKEINIYRIPEAIHKLAILDKIRIDCNEDKLFDVQLYQE